MISPEEFSHLRQLEQDWVAGERLGAAAGIPVDEHRWRWSPFDLEEFSMMLGIAVKVATQTGERMSFFEAGSGIGTKLKVAQDEYDLFAHGWEIIPEYIRVADDLGVSSEQLDLLKEDPHYGDWDIVYIAQPFKDDATEVAWERSVHEAMRPGGVLIATYASVKPYSWKTFHRAPWRGVWRKPMEAKS